MRKIEYLKTVSELYNYTLHSGAIPPFVMWTLKAHVVLALSCLCVASVPCETVAIFLEKSFSSSNLSLMYSDDFYVLMRVSLNPPEHWN